MAEETAPQASAAFGVPTAKVEEAKGLDLEAIGLEPVDDARGLLFAPPVRM